MKTERGKQFGISALVTNNETRRLFQALEFFWTGKWQNSERNCQREEEEGTEIVLVHFPSEELAMCVCMICIGIPVSTRTPNAILHYRRCSSTSAGRPSAGP